MKTVDVNTLVRENIKRLKPYSSARDDFQGTASIYLDANENPFNTDYNRYPDPHQVKLKQQIAALKNVKPAFVFLGNGSDEPIDLLIRAFCEPARDNVIIPQPTYGMYSVSAAVNNVEIRSVSLTENFDLDLQAVGQAWTEHTRIIFLCSPNNPSGNLLDYEKVKSLLSSFHGLVVVDEAYIDFAGYPGFLPLIEEFRNLVILQTLSKAWGLAGIRLGMCFANPEIIGILNKIKPPYNINSATLGIAASALTDEAKKNHWVTEIKTERKRLLEELMMVPMVRKIYPSDANFLLVQVADASKTYRDLVRRGIIVRDRSSVKLCENCLRITVGTRAENKALIDVLNQL